MVKTICLYDKAARLENTEPFIIPDDLQFNFKSVGYDLSNAFITLQNGTLKETFKLTNPFAVPADFLFAGRLLGKVEMYLDGKKVKTWNLYPLKIEETDGTIESFDEIADLLKRVEKLENEIEIDL